MGKTGRAEKPPVVSDRARWAVAFGWIAGACTGLLLSYAFFVWNGGMAATAAVTFVLFVGGALGGAEIANRCGDSSFKWLGIAAGIGIAAVLTLFLGTALGR